MFKLDPSGNETILHSFTGNSSGGASGDGANPLAGLTMDSAGNLYGTTSRDGTWLGGTVFKLDPLASETVLYSFKGNGDGADPAGALIMDSVGNLYGTTSGGGAWGLGTVFKLDSAGNETVLYSFTGPAGADPASALILDNAGNLYGSTAQGGVAGIGTVFRLAKLTSVSLSTDSLSFSAQAAGTTGKAQSITLTNSGTAPLYTRISITGPNARDFAQTSNCGVSVAAGGSCMMNVTFTPMEAGTRTASASVSDNASGSPQTVSLSGTGLAPSVGFSPSGLTFVNQLLGTTSSSQAVTLNNTGTAALTIANISITGSNAGDFAQTDSCGTSVAAGANCSIKVTFTPTTTGTRIASISISDNAAGSPQTVSLSATGVDFSFAAGNNGSTSATVTAGQTATYNLQLSPAGGFTGSVGLKCSGAPAHATCSVLPTSVTVSGASAVPFQVTVTTTTRTAMAASATGTAYSSPRGQRYAFLLACILFAAIGTRRVCRERAWAPIGALVCLTIAVVACGGGNNSSGTGGGGGTPAGKYNLTVTGTSQGASRTLALTLTVN